MVPKTPWTQRLSAFTNSAPRCWPNFKYRISTKLQPSLVLTKIVLQYPPPLFRFFTKKSCGTRMAKNGPKKAKTRLMTFFTRNMNTEQLLLRKKIFGSKVSLHSWAVWLNYVSSQSSSYIVHAKKSNEESGGRLARSFWCFVLIIREPVLLSTRIGCRSVFSGFCGELSRIIRAGDTSPTLPSIVY